MALEDAGRPIGSGHFIEFYFLRTTMLFRISKLDSENIYGKSDHFSNGGTEPEQPCESKGSNSCDQADEKEFARGTHPNGIGGCLQKQHQQHMEDVGTI